MLHRRLVTGVAAAAAATLAAAVLAAPATAAGAPRISVFAPAGAHSNVASDSFAGYTTTQIGIARASANFIAPGMTCPSGDTQGTAVGIGDEQTVGVPTVYALVFLACVGGAPYLTTQVFAGTEGASQSGSYNPGDHIRVLINQSPTRVTATLTNVTQASTIRASGTPVPDNTLIYGSLPLFSGSTTPLPVADFGSVVLAKPVLENTALSAWSPTKLVRKNGATTQINTSGFFASGGFRLSFAAN